MHKLFGAALNPKFYRILSFYISIALFLHQYRLHDRQIVNASLF